MSTTNPYLALVNTDSQAAVAGTGPASTEPTRNPYLAFVQQEAEQELRQSMQQAAGRSPDAEAKVQALAKQYGLPIESVRLDQPTIERRAVFDSIDYSNLPRTNPRTAQLLSDPNRASLAHDDVDNLSQTENVLREWQAPAPTAGSVVAGLARSTVAIGKQYSAALSLAMHDAFFDDGSDASKIITNDLKHKAAQAQAQIDYVTPEFESSTARGIYGGAQSLLQALPALAVSVATANPTPALAMGGLQAGLPAYSKYRNRGASPGMAALGATGEGAVEVATEKIPMGFLVNKFGKAGAGEFLTGLLARELPSEQVATFVQDAIDTSIANPDKTWSDFAKERPDAAYQTALATLVQAGAVGGVSAAAGRLQRRSGRAQAADQGAQVLDHINELATNSKLRERDPEAFGEFIKQATQDGPVKDLYIDVGALAQSPALDQVLAASPTVAAQYTEALASGGQIRIPVEEFASQIAGQDFAQPLIDHLKTDPNGFSRTEAQEFMQTAAEGLKAEIEQTLAQHENDRTFKESRDRVQAMLAQQMDTAGRFTPDTNQQYANLVANFYAVQGAKAGISPEEMAQRYSLRVLAESPAQPGRVLNQDSEAFKTWFGDSKVVDAGGKPLTVYHGTGASEGGDAFTSFDTYGSNYGLMGMGGYFTADPAVASSYTTKGRGATPTVYPVYLSIKNPLDMDAKAEPAAWAKAFDGVEVFHEGGDTNESWFRAAEDMVRDQAVPSYEGAEIMQDGLRQMGFDGITHIGGGRVKSDGVRHRVYIAFDPEQIKSATGNDGTFDANDPSILSQGDQAPRGTFNPDTNTITLLKAADLSTFLHEAGHFFLEVQADMASRPDAPESVKDDMAAALKWMGVEDLATWQGYDLDQQRPYHEQFARGFEAYLFEGKAPSLEMAGVFQRFRAWLLNVYKSIKNLNVELNDEIRGVFDRMLASSEQIKAAEAAREFGPLFETADDAAKYGVDWQAYHEQGVKATQDAISELETRSLRDMRWLSNARSRAVRELQREAATKRKAIREEVTAEVEAMPVFQAKAAIKALREQGAEVNKEAVAEAHGFTSADHLAKATEDLGPKKELIDGLVDQRMLERYGDLVDPRAVERAADQAVHNAARLKFSATELNALEKATGQRRTLTKAAKEFAENIVARQEVRNIRPAQYAAAEARASKAAAKALKAGKIDEAAQEKRNQLVQGYATRAAYDAQTEVEKALRYFNRFTENGTSSLATDYKDQIDALLERYDLRKATSNKDIARRKSLKSWLEAQQEMGIEPEIPDSLLEGIDRRSYKELTLEELRGLVDTVKQIEHIGRLKQKLLTAKDQREFDETISGLIRSIEANAGGAKADNRTRANTQNYVQRMFAGFLASHRKVASLAREMDGFKDGGPMWETLIRTMNEAGDREATMRAEATTRLAEMVKPLLKGGTMGGKGEFFPSIKQSLNREERIGIALNFGNEGNIQRLLDGEGWSRAQVQPVLDTLTAQDWQFVQATWDFFESYRPEIAAKEKRVYGKEPEWVEPSPVQTKHGEFRGGYYPIKYDPRRSGRAESHAEAEAAKAQMRGAYVSATTRRSFTKSRADEVKGRPLLYSMDGLYQGVNEVIHDLTWHEWLIDANRVLKAVDGTMRDSYGAEVVSQFKSAVKDIAAGDAPTGGAWGKFLGHMRSGAMIAGLGFNIMNAAINVVGITQSMVRVGPRWIAQGIGEFATSPRALVEQVHEKSPFMALRAQTMNREISEIQSRVRGKSEARVMLDRLMFLPMELTQMVVDTPTWWGAYQKALAEGNEEARAVSLADQAVIDSQGGGQVKDLAAIQRGDQFQKLLTTFYGFFSTTYNLGVESTKATDFKNPAQVIKLAGDYLLLYSLPAVLGVVLKGALTGDDDLEDPEKLAKKLIGAHISYLMGNMVGVREVTAAAQKALGVQEFNTAYAGPAGLRFLQEVDKLGQQVGAGQYGAAFLRSAINVTGITLHLPSGQVNRTIDGITALTEGKTVNPVAPLVGGPPKN